MNSGTVPFDGDTMLILALACLLYKQGADKALVLALLSVIFPM